jgi:hypothetical protein
LCGKPAGIDDLLAYPLAAMPSTYGIGLFAKMNLFAAEADVT